MLLDDLRVKKEAIISLGNQYGARHIRVFGSVARCEEEADSDIDFLVEFPRGYSAKAKTAIFQSSPTKIMAKTHY